MYESSLGCFTSSARKHTKRKSLFSFCLAFLHSLYIHFSNVYTIFKYVLFQCVLIQHWKNLPKTNYKKKQEEKTKLEKKTKLNQIYNKFSVRLYLTLFCFTYLFNIFVYFLFLSCNSLTLIFNRENQVQLIYVNTRKMKHVT